jgi:hypothetical protein
MTAESEFILQHAEIFQAGFDTQPSVWWGPAAFFPQVLHSQDKKLTTDINLRLRVKKQRCALCICISPGATLPSHHFLSGCLSVFCLQYLSCLVQYKICTLSFLSASSNKKCVFRNLMTWPILQTLMQNSTDYVNLLQTRRKQKLKPKR